MVINIQDDILKLHAAGLLDRLLADKTTGQNILWATDAYAERGEDYGRDRPITAALITGENSDIIKTRARKAMEQQSERTKSRGEVFTPLRVCGKMIDYADEMWFGRAAGFHKTDEQGHIRFTQKRSWQKYVTTTRLEITCGEAPFLVQRYDVETGEAIPVEERSGILDRKLRVVSENAADEADWLAWAEKAVQATYGYEFQGDNLLIARVNVWMTVEEHFQHWRGSQPGKRPRKLTKPEGRRLCEIIAWNLWQMDGLTGAIPYRKPEEEMQMDFLYQMDGLPAPVDDSQPPCSIYDWNANKSIEYLSLKKESRDMKFSFVIGNPPYQEDRQGDSNTALPIYHYFIDSAYEISDVVELITPARFLFNAGRTPKPWNKKMLEDKHFKVLHYEKDASTIFPSTEIKGGVVISYRNARQEHEPVGTFTVYDELNTILHKVRSYIGGVSIASLGFVATKFNTNNLFHDYPKYEGHERRMSSNVLTFDCFHESKKNDDVMIYGVIQAKRLSRYIAKEYVDLSDPNILKYKIVTPKAEGNGMFGDTLTNPEVLPPDSGFTHTFLGIGGFDTEAEAYGALKYLKCKFTRTLLSVLKITQDLNAEKFKYVPLQDFTPASDIDWSKSVADIDRQLYAKYGLDEKEIEFIETHVKEMV